MYEKCKIYVSKIYPNQCETLYPDRLQQLSKELVYGDINKYKIAVMLGSGKFSNVFLGTDGKRKLAFKVFKDCRTNYIKHEIFAIKQCQESKHIIKLHDVIRDEHSGALTLVMDYHKSQDYHEVSKNITLTDIKKFIYELLMALDHCHSRGIMHRDVKFGNILYNLQTKKVTLTDFGLAEFYEPKSSYNTCVGTRRYMAPELLIGYKYYNYAVDIWSAGVVLGELLIGHSLFQGETHEDILKSITWMFTSSPLLIMAESLNFDVSPALLSVLSSNSFSKFEEIKNLISPDKQDDLLLDLLKNMLNIDFRERCSANSALSHKCFDDIRDLYS